MKSLERKNILPLLLLIGIFSLQLAVSPLGVNYAPSTVINTHTFLRTSEDVTLNSSITVSAGSTLEYINRTIYYNSLETPIFTVYGTLKLINCTIIPLKGSVDFISATHATIFLENVTLLNPSGKNNSVFSISDSRVYLNRAIFSGFHDGSISSSNNVYISNMYVNLTDHLIFNDARNLTIANSRINLLVNDQVRLLEISSSDGVSLINNTIKIPLEAVETYSAWLEGISLHASTNIIVKGNTVINGGKTLVSYGSSNILIVNNTFRNEKLVEGTELQIDSGSEDVLIANNSFSMLWEAIETYSYKNITATGNTFTQSHIGIKVEPSTSTVLTEVYVSKNTFTNSNFFMISCNGMVVENNTIENSDVFIIDSNNVTFRRNILRNATLEITDSNDITVIDNTIYVFEGNKWLDIENSTVTESDNRVITLPNPSGNLIGGENGFDVILGFPNNLMFLGVSILLCLGLVALIVILRRRKVNKT